jgi:hypothetical protein
LPNGRVIALHLLRPRLDTLLASLDAVLADLDTVLPGLGTVRGSLGVLLGSLRTFRGSLLGTFLASFRTFGLALLASGGAIFAVRTLSKSGSRNRGREKKRKEDSTHNGPQDRRVNRRTCTISA